MKIFSFTKKKKLYEFNQNFFAKNLGLVPFAHWHNNLRGLSNAKTILEENFGTIKPIAGGEG